MSEAAELKNMEDYRQYLRQVTAIQSETIRRLVNDGATPPLEVAAVLEDVANHFLDLSDEIREFALAHPGAALRSPSALNGEADRA